MPYNKSDAASELGIAKSELEKRAKAAGFDNTEQYYWSLGKSSAGSSGEYGTTGMAGGDPFAAQAQKESDFLGRFTNYVGSQPSMQSIWDTVSQNRGLDQLRQTSFNTGQMVENIPQNVKTIGTQYGISAPRQQQRIRGETEKLLPGYQKAVSQEQFAQEGAAQDIQNYLAQQQIQLMPYEMEASLLSDASARAVTGYTSQMQNQLQINLAKLAQQGALDQMELQQTIDLAMAENEFENAKELYKFQQENKGSGDVNGTNILQTLDNIRDSIGRNAGSGLNYTPAYYTPAY